MRAKGMLILAVVSAVFLPFLGLPATLYAQELKIGGSGFGLGAVKMLANAFEKSHPGIKILVVPSLGSAGGIKALLRDSLDVAISGRPLENTEKGAGASEIEVGRTPFVFIVNARAAVEGMTSLELANIYNGKTLRWPDGTRVRVVIRPETDTTTKTLRSISPAVSQAVTSAMSREGVIKAITDQESADIVEKTPGALAAATLTQVYAEGRKVKVLAFNGVNPSVKGVGNGSYPLATPLYLITTARATTAAREFAGFVLSSEGRSILKRCGNYPTKERHAQR